MAVDELRFPGLARLRRSTLLGRALAILVGIVVVVPVASAGTLGKGLMLAPAAFAAVQIAGVLGVDLLTFGAARTAGAASLEVRRTRDYLPGLLTRLTASVGAVLAVVLIWSTVVASPDDLGRAGRSFGYACGAGCTGAVGPWPGSYYAIPLGAGLLGLCLVAGLAILFTLRRPRNGSDPEVVRVDDVVRRRSVESVLASVGIAFSGSLAGIGLVTSSALGSAAGNQGPAQLQPAAWICLLLGLASAAVLLWCAVVLMLPGAGKPAGQRPSESSAGSTAGPDGAPR